MFRPLEAIIRSGFGYPEEETCRLIIKIPYISCNKLFSNSCLVFNLNYYKFVVLDVHTLLFSIKEKNGERIWNKTHGCCMHFRMKYVQETVRCV